MNKLKLGGVSQYNNVTLYSDNFSASVDMKTGNIEVTRDEENSFLNFINRIPFVRGPALLAFMVYKGIKPFFSGIVPFLFFIFLIFAGLGLAMLVNTYDASTAVGGIHTTYFEITFFVLIGIFFYFVRENHGAEHKVIAGYESGDYSIDNIKKQKKEHHRCGSTFVVWAYILCAIAAYLLRIELNFILGLIVWSVAFEIARLSDYRGVKYIIFLPSWLLQKFVTKEPSQEKIEKVRKGLLLLIQEEERLCAD